MPIAELTLAFPWGLCFLEDPQVAEEIPPIEELGQPVSVARTAVSFVVQHEVDGDSTVRLHLAPFESTGDLVFEGVIESVSGEMRLSDATASVHASALVGAGEHRIRVFADHPGSPEVVDIVVG